ncbi:geranylgeranyl diphosphate synthase, type II [Ekhidna lutea]|uniref:Geranylgeranyl diphosphate synthase, type II n=1 Tax=Ekhidna lutea TaxID=447679 RepID=A0A239EZQ2_EKHLU|nr:polyprenyl synthetase family protein [Ekhidna lutea]SNS49314.1 geranylgeranyl diphosphate synthase, type II [Ekhidna lutea]
MKDLLEKIDSSLANLPLGEHPQNLYDPIRYILSLGGKRLRPMLVLLGYGLKNEDIESIIDPSLTVEIFHNFTLMHDDIMDLAPIRRGKPTVHEKWNNTVAILSGDTMMVKAYDQLLTGPHQSLPLAIQKFNKCAVEVCEGQQLDMNFEEFETVTEGQYIEMIRLKTAVLLGFSLEYGGLLAGMKTDQLAKLNAIGVKAGIGFQLMDDLLDVYGDKAKFGKQVGGDIASNKKTYLLIKALELAAPAQRKELDKWLSASDYEVDDKVKAVKSIYEEIGIFELTQKKMNDYYDEAFELLNQFDARKDGKDQLAEFLRRLMNREQ